MLRWHQLDCSNPITLTDTWQVLVLVWSCLSEWLSSSTIGNPSSYMANIVIVHSYVSSIDTTLHMISMDYPRITSLQLTVLWISIHHPWMSTVPVTPLLKYPWMTMWHCISMDYPYMRWDTLTRGSLWVWHPWMAYGPTLYLCHLRILWQGSPCESRCPQYSKL